VYSDRFGSWLRAAPVRGGSHRRQREVVDSDDDREGGHSHSGHDTHDGHPPHRRSLLHEMRTWPLWNLSRGQEIWNRYGVQ
jgi:hypothetical protein